MRPPALVALFNLLPGHSAVSYITAYFRSLRLIRSLLERLTFRITFPVSVRYVWKPKKSRPFRKGKICVFWFSSRPLGVKSCSTFLHASRSASLLSQMI